jgi:hypothetical protein
VRSPLYTQLRNGQARYLHFCLEKAAAPTRGE